MDTKIIRMHNKTAMVFVLLVLLILGNGCGQGREKVPDVSAVAGEESSQRQIQEEEQKVIDYLANSVPEIKELVKGHKDNHLIMEVQSVPNPTETDRFQRDYYEVYIGFYIADGGPGHRSRWGTFLVSKGLDEILWANPADNTVTSLVEWRKAVSGPNSGLANITDGSQVNNDWLCIPFQRVGPLTSKTTESDLIRIFGGENVQRRSTYGPEGMETYEVSVIFSDTPNQLVVFWRNNRYGSEASSVSIRRQGAAWKTVQGISTGTSLAELNRINGQPFQFFGFGWDYGGTVCLFGPGTLTSVKGLRLVLIPARELPREFYGDRKLDSGDFRLLPDAVIVGRLDIDLSDDQAALILPLSISRS